MSADNLPEDFYDVTPEDIAHAKRHEEARKHVRSGRYQNSFSCFRIGGETNTRGTYQFIMRNRMRHILLISWLLFLQAESQLKTRALREAAERSRAEAYGPIPVRVHLPDNTIVPAAFSALEPLSKLQVGRFTCTVFFYRHHTL